MGGWHYWQRCMPIYRWLRRHNGKMVMCAFGMDYYWVNGYVSRHHLRYSDPFEQYREMVDGSDLILDQLYSYTPSMNPLMAMSKGIVCVGGGEPENYEILGETTLRPIINVQPTEQSVYDELEKVVLHPGCLPKLRSDSREYVLRHHEYMHVARMYEALYKTRKPRT